MPKKKRTVPVLKTSPYFGRVAWIKSTFSWEKVSRFLLKANREIFPHLFVVTNLFLFIETATFQGFVRKYFFLQPQFFFFATIASFLGIIWLNFQEKREYLDFQGTKRLVLELNKLFFIPILLINYLLVTLEVYNYPNYVYSHFHINPYNFNSIVSLNAVILILQILVSFRYPLPSRVNAKVVDYRYVIEKILKRKYSVVQIAFFLLVFFCIFPQVQDALTTMHIVAVKIIQNADKSEDEKFMFELGGEKYTGWIVEYTKFVNEHVPDHAVIFTPPQKEAWQMEGNQYFLRWFIFPRNIVTSQDVEAPIPPEADYVMIAYGAWPWGVTQFGWPRISIPKEKIERIYYIDRNTKEETEVEGQGYEYVPGQEVWGVIQLKK